MIHHNSKKPYYLFQQTTKKVTTEPNVIEPEKIDEQVPNEDIVKEHSKPVYSKQPYDDHMDSSMADPESSYNKKKVIIWDI